MCKKNNKNMSVKLIFADNLKKIWQRPHESVRFPYQIFLILSMLKLHSIPYSYYFFYTLYFAIIIYKKQNLEILQKYYKNITFILNLLIYIDFFIKKDKILKEL